MTELLFAHLGLDYGTGATKMVFQIQGLVGEPDRFVVVRNQNDGGCRFPSATYFDGGKLFVADEALRRAARDGRPALQSSKVRFAFGGAPPGDGHDGTLKGWSWEDVVTAEVLFALREGWEAIDSFGRARARSVRAGFTMGAPFNQLDQWGFRKKFLRIAWVAWQLRVSDFGDPAAGWKADALRAAIVQARESFSPPSRPDEWVRSEVASAMVWPFHSPDLPKGLYGAIDVGAGTSNASFFMLSAVHDGGHWRKDGLSFLGAATSPPGMDEVGQTMFGEDWAARRGDEARCAGKAMYNVHFKRVATRIFDNYAEAFQRSFPKLMPISAWDHFLLVIFGGGARLSPLVDELVHHPHWRKSKNAPWRPKVLRMGVPDDLGEADRRRIPEDDAWFLLVAYGLAHRFSELPVVKGPDDTEPVDLRDRYRRLDVDWESIYSK